MGDNLIYFDICSCGSFMPITTAYIFQWRRKVPKSVCGWAGAGGGGEGGTHRHVIYVPSVKNQYKRVVFGYMVIY